MNPKGYCFFSDDIAHIIVVISDPNKDLKVLFVPISSIKFDPLGKYEYNGNKCRYYDPSCALDLLDIIADNGRSVLTKPSFVLYRKAEELSSNDIAVQQLASKLEYRCKVPNAILAKIQAGAKITCELEGRFKEYFDLF